MASPPVSCSSPPVVSTESSSLATERLDSLLELWLELLPSLYSLPLPLPLSLPDSLPLSLSLTLPSSLSLSLSCGFDFDTGAFLALTVGSSTFPAMISCIFLFLSTPLKELSCITDWIAFLFAIAVFVSSGISSNMASPPVSSDVPSSFFSSSSSLSELLLSGSLSLSLAGGVGCFGFDLLLTSFFFGSTFGNSTFPAIISCIFLFRSTPLKDVSCITDCIALRFANAALFSSGISCNIASPPVRAPSSSPPSLAADDELSLLFSDATDTLSSLLAEAWLLLLALLLLLLLLLLASLPLSLSSLSLSSNVSFISSNIFSSIPTLPPSSNSRSVSLILTTLSKSVPPLFVILLCPKSTHVNVSLSNNVDANSVAPLSLMALNRNIILVMVEFCEDNTLNKSMAPTSPITFPLKLMDVNDLLSISALAKEVAPTSPILLSSIFNVVNVLLYGITFDRSSNPSSPKLLPDISIVVNVLLSNIAEANVEEPSIPIRFRRKSNVVTVVFFPS